MEKEKLVHMRRDNAVKIAATPARQAELQAKGYEVIDEPGAVKEKGKTKDSGKDSGDGQSAAN